MRPLRYRSLGGLRPLGLVFLWTGLSVLLQTPADAQQLTSPAFWNNSGGWSSSFQVQNTTAGTATFNITYYNPDGSVNTQVNDSMPANFTKNYDTATTPDKLPKTGFDGSVVIQSDVPLVGTVNHHHNPSNDNALFSFQSGGDAKVSTPLNLNFPGGFQTFTKVQNLGNSAASVTASYFGSPACDETRTIPPSGTATFDLATGSCLPVGYWNAATLTADQPIAVNVFEITPDSVLGYNGFPQSTGSTTLYLPLVFRGLGSFTNAQVQNVGGSPITVTASYTPNETGQPCSETKTVPPGGSTPFEGTSGDCDPSQEFRGSAVITASGPTVAAVEMFSSFGPAGGASYNGFNPAHATRRVVMPHILDRRLGNSTGFHVVNIGADATSINCTFFNTSHPVSATILPGMSFHHDQFNNIGDNYIGSASCTSTNEPIVGLVNERGSLAAYEAFNVAAAENCEGDFDQDSDVDGSDLAAFAADFGRTDCGSGDPCEGDFNNDGDVDGSDLAVFAADFGRTDCP